MGMAAAPQRAVRSQHEPFCTLHMEQQSAQAVGWVDAGTCSGARSACRCSGWEGKQEGPHVEDGSSL